MSKTNYAKLHDKDYADLCKKYDEAMEQNAQLKELNKRFNLIIDSNKAIELILGTLNESNKMLTKTVNDLNVKLAEKDALLIKALEENERLKKNNNKDSSNSSKPSSTDGSKKVITNRREPSNKSKGGQKGHVPHTFKNDKVDELLKMPNVVLHEVKISDPFHKMPMYKIDIDTVVTVTKYITEDENYDQLNPVIYGENIKSNVTVLSIDNYMSTDGIVRYINSITNNVINLSKGTVCNWIKEFSNNLDDEIIKITNGLLDNYFIQADDSQIKINKENYNQLCLCNDFFVLLSPSKRKNREAWDKTPLSKYIGAVIKDGADIFDSYGVKRSQCISHILRYLKAAFEFGNRKSAFKMKSFLTYLNDLRNKLISLDITCFTNKTLKKYEKKYDEIISEWEQEFKPYEKSKVYTEEKNLLKRMKTKDKEQILAFIYDFKLPSTNNNAESCQRGLKIKQKIGKFRSEEGAEYYCRAKSFILSLKKQKKPIFDNIKNIFLKKLSFS